MNAFLLAAGLGTRLRPLTNDRPKALVEINGVSLLEYNIQNLINQGFTNIVVNIHHFPDMIIDFLQNHHFEANILISDERKKLLDTGGALKKASRYFSSKDPVLVHNVDIISSLNLKDFYDKHLRTNALATLIVSRRNTSRYLLFDNKKQLVGWKNTSTNEEIWSDTPLQNTDNMAFSGIHIVNPEFFDLLPPEDTYPIIPEYLKIAQSHKILSIEHRPEQWLDVGKPETLKKAESFINQLNTIKL